MIPLWVQRSEIYDEFSDEEKKRFFDIKRDKYLPGIDNFYYSVHLFEAATAGIEKLIKHLNQFAAVFNVQEEPPEFHGFTFYPFGMKGYNFRLSKPECYDILIRESLPNDRTSRIWVQIRARYIWLNGTRKCLKESYEELAALLDDYGIFITEINENRVDYCVHTNAIQSPEKFFDRPKLKQHCKTNARIYNLVGNPQNDWSLDYCSIGSRKSNALFFRMYNKTREVVEQNYKAFFYSIWRENGLISEYDQFCLEHAFKLKSYDVGVLVGQILWYIEFGKNDILVNQLKDLYNEYYVKNSNTRKIRDGIKFGENQFISQEDLNNCRKVVNSVLPPVTVILNIEFETHRDFYRSFDNSLMQIYSKKRVRPNMLARVNLIYGLRAKFFDYLTSYGNFVSFVRGTVVIERNTRDGLIVEKVPGTKVKQSEFTDVMYQSFWKRLRSVNWNTKFNPELTRSYERKIDLERMKRKVTSDVATLSLYTNGVNDNDLTCDFTDAVMTINDNQMHSLFFVDPTTGEVPEIKYGDHAAIKQRKIRQLKSILPSAGPVDDNKHFS